MRASKLQRGLLYGEVLVEEADQPKSTKSKNIKKDRLVLGEVDEIVELFWGDGGEWMPDMAGKVIYLDR